MSNFGRERGRLRAGQACWWVTLICSLVQQPFDITSGWGGRSQDGQPALWPYARRLARDLRKAGVIWHAPCLYPAQYPRKDLERLLKRPSQLASELISVEAA